MRIEFLDIPNPTESPADFVTNVNENLQRTVDAFERVVFRDLDETMSGPLEFLEQTMKIVNGTIIVTPPIPIDPPVAPVLSIGDDQFVADLSWTAGSVDSDDTLTGYTLYRSENGGAFAAVVTQVGLTYIDTDLTYGSDYEYYVVTNGTLGGESDPSNSVEFLMASELTPPELDFSEQSITYDDPQPSGLIFATEPFDTDTGQFTLSHYGSDPQGTLTFTGGKGHINTVGAFNTTFCRNTNMPLDYPQWFISMDVGTQTGGSSYMGINPGMYYDSNNAVFIDCGALGGNFLGASITSIFGGTKSNGGTTHAGVPSGVLTSVAFACVFGFCMGYVKIGSDPKWYLATSRSFSGFNTVGAFSGWYAGFSVWCGGSYTLDVDNLKWGRFGGAKMRDQNFVTLENGTPYFPSPGVAMFTATVFGSYIGIFTLDLTTFAITQVGVAIVQRSGSYVQDLNLSIVLMDNGTAKAVTATWGNGFGGSIQCQLHSLADWSILSGTTILASGVTMTLPGQLSGSYGVYDPHLVYDVTNTRWLIAYSITQNTNFSGSPFYAAAAYSTDLSTWTLIGADTTHQGYEGTKLSFHKGEWWVSAGGPAGASTSSRVYHASDMSFAGTLDIVFDGGTSTQPHPPSIKYGSLVYLLTFDDDSQSSINFTWGDPHIYTAPRYA